MGQRSEELQAQARASAPLAAARSADGLLLAKAQGCRVFDADNVAYIDLVGGGGTNLLGYANQYVLDAVRKASTLGLASGFHSIAEIELVEQLESLLPALSPWVVTGSETEAWELALRWARRRTGRQRLIVFDANRRGSVETFALVPAGQRGISHPDIEGVPTELARLVRIAPWGDADAFSEVIADTGVDVAAVVLDPLASGAGVWSPNEVFLRTVEAETRRAGACLVLDETLTGLRIARGGASEIYGITPDIAVFGGALGGGVAQIGAVSWPRAAAATPGDELPPAPPPHAVLAATATISVLRNDAIHQRLEERGAQLQNGIEALAERSGRPLRLSRVGSVFACAFSKRPLTGPQLVHRADQNLWGRFARATRENGVLLPSRSPFPSFLSHAHGVKDIEQALLAMETGLKKIQKEDED
jgi:glutamate-1-semialdehyde 2,1-aminomutase